MLKLDALNVEVSNSCLSHRQIRPVCRHKGALRTQLIADIILVPGETVRRRQIEDICGQLDAVISNVRMGPVTTRSRDATVRRLAAIINRGLPPSRQLETGRNGGIDGLRMAARSGLASWGLRVADGFMEGGSNPLARQDLLTGLANRMGLSEDLQQVCGNAETAGAAIAALCIDLDGLNRINDGYGYGAGDELLREVARRLKQHGGQTDLIARLDGDKFVIVQTVGDQPASARALAERLLKALAEPFILADAAPERLTASIGIACYPEHAATPDALLLRATSALGQVKQSGRNSCAIYDAEKERHQRARHRLEQDLRIALQKHEFRLVYQPLFSTQDRGVTGFEALLRWTSAEHGVVPPDIFIPIAERMGLMKELGEWVLHEACREAARWSVPLRIAVNVSPAQIHEDGLADKIDAVLRETGLPPNRLEIEITETLLLKNTESVIETLQRIRKLGVQIAIDDFGTGYSSLAALRAFPFDKLKVDRSFIRDLGQVSDALPIVEAIFGLSRGLRLPVVAEGVETEMQAAILKSCGCDELQGYLLGHPLPIEGFAQLTGTSALSRTAFVQECLAV